MYNSCHLEAYNVIDTAKRVIPSVLQLEDVLNKVLLKHYQNYKSLITFKWLSL
jgi:hypothetical protein